MTPLEYLYGRPERAVPALGLSFSILVGLLFQSFSGFTGTAILLATAWSYWSARLVIQDQRLGPIRLTCPESRVWLTFDDGPGPDTLEIVRTLNSFGCRATFFFIGEQLEGYAQLSELREALRQGGHTVANHSYSHPNFLTLSKQAALGEVKRTEALLKETFPEMVLPLFRPPFGYRKGETFEVAQEMGLEVVGWRVNSLDFLDGPPERMLRRLRGEVSPGDIVLFHDGREDRKTTVGALPGLLDWLKARGYRTYNGHSP
jgi:peptidoglycan/xylan/chitin deacetylase (PgdA/CDA1 family)